MATDADLLRRYVSEHDEPAFAELVQRHLGLVYAAALRRTGGRPDLAEDIAQRVFCDLARKAAPLVHHPALTAWLYRSTRYAAIDAIRAEVRRHKLNQTLTAMPSPTASDTPAEWEQLRPVLDEAMDQLKEPDRQLMLLRYFNGLTFAEAGARLSLTEDNARRRTERALEKLRVQLGRRGISSTSAALGLLLANQPMVAVPPHLGAAVTGAALAVAPIGGIATAGSAILMSKITAPLLSAIVAASLTAIVWTSAARNLQPELAAARQENARLVHAGASDAAALADEYTAQAAAIARAMEQRHAARAPATPMRAMATADEPGAVTARGHRNHGRATPHDAALTFAWACDLADPVELARMVYFDPEAREKAAANLAMMPDSIRAQYPTPEDFYGLLLAASCLEAPPPGADLMQRFMTEVEVSPGRFATRRLGSTRNVHEYQSTPGGWKYVIPPRGIGGLPRILNSETLAKLGQP